jgi:hypothetical protein
VQALLLRGFRVCRLKLRRRRSSTGKGQEAKFLGSYVEVESGKRDDRPELARAMERARLTGAVLLDREARSAFPRRALPSRSAKGRR